MRFVGGKLKDPFFLVWLAFFCLLSCGWNGKAPKGGEKVDFSPATGSGDVANIGDGKNHPDGKNILHALEAVIEKTKENDWASLYEEMVDPPFPENQFTAQGQMLVRQYGEIDTYQVKEIFLVHAKAKKTNTLFPQVQAIQVTSSVLPDPTLLHAPKPGELAIAIVETTSKDLGLKCWGTVILEKFEKNWKFQTLHLSLSQVAGHGGQWFFDLAEEEEKKGNLRNALLLRKQGAILLIPGPYLACPEINIRYQKFLSGTGPQNMPLPGIRPAEQWDFEGSQSFLVTGVDIVGFAKFFALEIRYTSELADVNSPPAEKERGTLFELVRKRFPEYEDVFAGVYIGSVTSTGQGWREYFPFKEGDPEPGNH